MQALESQVLDLYRFADRAKDVNWAARYTPDSGYIKSTTPAIYDFIDNSLRAVTYRPDSLRAVVGVSGGLDSAVAAWLTAQTMRRAMYENRAKDTSLVMIGFHGSNEEDLAYARRFADSLGSEYKELEIDFQERDLRPLMLQVDDFNEGIINGAGQEKTYSGELATRLIDCLVLEFANKTEHCSMESTNRSEIAIGEIVIGSGAECAPIQNFYKSEVFDIAEKIGVPQYIIDRDPVNSAFGSNKVRSYFGEIPDGMKARDVYRVLDPALFLFLDRGYSPEQVSEALGHSPEFSQRLYTRVRNQENRRVIPVFRRTSSHSEDEIERYVRRAFMNQDIVDDISFQTL